MSTLIGRTIKNVRWMTAAEKEAEGWDDPRQQATVIELDDGSTFYPSQDEEGNGPGAMFGTNAAGETVFVVPPQART